MRYQTLITLLTMVQGDRRCLLEGGGSTDTFFIREDTRVGEEIGKIRVEGRLDNQNYDNSNADGKNSYLDF